MKEQRFETVSISAAIEICDYYRSTFQNLVMVEKNFVVFFIPENKAEFNVNCMLANAAHFVDGFNLGVKFSDKEKERIEKMHAVIKANREDRTSDPDKL
jgi:hypothetical protein